MQSISVWALQYMQSFERPSDVLVYSGIFWQSTQLQTRVYNQCRMFLEQSLR